VRNRDFDPYQGRWIQEDPAGFKDSLNLYQYGFGTGVGVSDPSGLSADPFEQFGATGDHVGSGSRSQAGRQMVRNVYAFGRGVGDAIAGAVKGVANLPGAVVRGWVEDVKHARVPGTSFVIHSVEGAAQGLSDIKDIYDDWDHFSEEEKAYVVGRITGE